MPNSEVLTGTTWFNTIASDVPNSMAWFPTNVSDVSITVVWFNAIVNNYYMLTSLDLHIIHILAMTL